MNLLYSAESNNFEVLGSKYSG